MSEVPLYHTANFEVILNNPQEMTWDPTVGKPLGPRGVPTDEVRTVYFSWL
jgi:hypothetical protein